ncbi:molybdopterin synthase catalytic subunit [Parasteatoda tepidariorum]|uniref:molybdopterin synthase catalytic subunit n=1 Tax=Parasteatoda tepidariorum TaxID=114398 RepID=UPI001C71BEA5|nr:molybdopterin synthase catalytic subunit [Parasteatoda tepidariorum]
MDYIAVTKNKIDINEVFKTLSHPSCGGTACFIGTTRDDFNGKKVIELQYEAYESMAVKELEKISRSMKQKWPIFNVVLIHRIGCVPICETSVVVAASAVHRKEALDAVSYGIDTIKSEVPIWKKEKYCDGTSDWKVNCECKSVTN